MALSPHTRTRLVRVEGKKVRAHRHFMELHLGRPLVDDEEVHHVNHDPLDNRIENLVVMKRADHIALHAAEKQIYPDLKLCVECGAEFKANPRKRSRAKTCSPVCAQAIRVRGMMKGRGVWCSSRKSRK